MYIITHVVNNLFSYIKELQVVERWFLKQVPVKANREAHLTPIIPAAE